jgi:hypothetical protein
MPARSVHPQLAVYVQWPAAAGAGELGLPRKYLIFFATILL